MMQIPDRWIVIRITTQENEPIDKVFASWYGGYLTGGGWRLNSGIETTTEDDGYYYFYGYSGSCYKCRKDCQGVVGYHNKGILKTIIEQIEKNGGKVEQISYDTQIN